MQITLLHDKTISENGLFTRSLEKDRTYTVSDTAARDLIATGFAVEYKLDMAFEIIAAMKAAGFGAALIDDEAFKEAANRYDQKSTAGAI